MSEIKTEYNFKPTPPKVIALTGEQYDKLLAEAREQEREACLDIVEAMMIRVSNYPNGSFSADAPKNRALAVHLQELFSKIAARRTKEQ